MDLAAAEIELIGINEKEFIIKKAVETIRDRYDFIIIDCPPSLNLLTINAMTTADTVLVPIQCEYYALEGLSQLIHTINLVRERLNPYLDIEGIVFTMFDSQNKSVPAGGGKCPGECKAKSIQHNHTEKCAPGRSAQSWISDYGIRSQIHRRRELSRSGRRGHQSAEE